MTQIDFCFNVSDKLRLVTRYAGKSLRQETRLFIYTPDAHTTGQIRHALWSTDQTSFLPHCGNADPLAAETPIIVDHAAEPPIHDDVLLNLCPTHPPFFSRFQRLIEIVGLEEEDKAAARERFRFYRDRGYEIHRHDMMGKA